MASTKIEWTDRTWNPATGCTKISAGCQNCYASRMAHRLNGRYGYPLAPNEFKVTLHPGKLWGPPYWRKPSMIFVDSMGDLFHKDVPDDFILSVFAVMSASQQHMFQILTKRAERLLQWFEWAKSKLDRGLVFPASPWPLPNVWLGVSAENQECADERIPWLLKTPAVVRFVSVEPMLAAIDLTRIPINNTGISMNVLQRASVLAPHVHWVICGCESGPKARPTNTAWARDLRDQCSGAGIPFFLKQLVIDGKLEKMPTLDGRQWAEMPQSLWTALP